MMACVSGEFCMWRMPSTARACRSKISSLRSEQKRLQCWAEPRFRVERTLRMTHRASIGTARTVAAPPMVVTASPTTAAGRHPTPRRQRVARSAFQLRVAPCTARRAPQFTSSAPSLVQSCRQVRTAPHGGSGAFGPSCVRAANLKFCIKPADFILPPSDVIDCSKRCNFQRVCNGRRVALQAAGSELIVLVDIVITWHGVTSERLAT